MTDSIDLTAIKDRLVGGTGGYEGAHESPGLELGVYVLVAPEPDRQQPHADDEVYVASRAAKRWRSMVHPAPGRAGGICPRPAPTTASSGTRT